VAYYSDPLLCIWNLWLFSDQRYSGQHLSGIAIISGLNATLNDERKQEDLDGSLWLKALTIRDHGEQECGR
jgi:hypothetical protein